MFLGEHLLLGRRAAVKVLHPSLAVHKQIVERFFTEARAMSALHPAPDLQRRIEALRKVIR